MAKENRRTSLDKNPLAQAFGLAIKELRGDSQSSFIAETLGVSNSFVRLIEIGAANIHTGKTLRVIRAFPQIEFQALSKILVTITITDQYKESTDRYREAVKDVIAADKDSKDRKFEQLIGSMNKILVAFESSADPMDSILESMGFRTAMQEYLTTVQSNVYRTMTNESEGRFGEPDEDDLKFESLLYDTPSIYVDSISLSLKNLKTINPNLFVLDSSGWEKENNLHFIKLVAVVKDLDRILRSDNLEDFAYDYLMHSNFKELNFLVLNEANNAQVWEKKFADALRERWGYKKNIPEHVKIALKKIKVRKANAQDKGVREIMTTEANPQGNELLWVFVTSRGNKVGFSMKSKEQEYKKNLAVAYGATLSYHESRLKYRQFMSLWNQSKRS